ncbi:hypothetical protein [Planomonospora sp. ID82291]|uniref:hypothetical protein n=1 Tax=Planomonospora sp. ID82291 TaxID=2738136 RepID=UPI0018C441D2|nr:hypothetical protein [Planomonospora sp. ID82291]MBG0814650.1 hypothetical protein [Planomonospora sp. ID82291]
MTVLRAACPSAAPAVTGPQAACAAGVRDEGRGGAQRRRLDTHKNNSAVVEVAPWKSCGACGGPREPGLLRVVVGHALVYGLVAKRGSQRHTMPESSVTEENGPQVGKPKTPQVEIGDIDQILLDAQKNQRASLIKDYLAKNVGDDSLDWIGELCVKAVKYGLSIQEIRSVVTDLAWISREKGERLPSEAVPIPVSAHQHYDLYRLVRAYALGQRLRFDFKFDSLRDVSQGWLNDFDSDALILSFVAFAALGLRQPHGLDLYQRALDAPDADRRSRHVCLSGMWLAYQVEGQAEKMLELSGQMMAKGEIDENVFFRRASALRKLGKYEQALEEIDHAIHMLGIGNNAVHQDYVRERESIIVSMQMRQYAESLAKSIGNEVVEIAEKRIEEASRSLTHKIETAQRVVSESLLKIVEILGLFVTLSGFLVGSGVVVFKATTFSERAIVMTLFVVGSLIFFTLLRLVTGFRRRERRERRIK